jgi:hypothetical protein
MAHQTETKDNNSERAFYESDFFASFIIGYLDWNPLKFSLVVLAFVVLIYVLDLTVMALMPGTYGPDGWFRFLLRILSDLSLPCVIICVPALAAIYIWSSKVPGAMFTSLEEEGVLTFDSEMKKKEFNDRLTKIYSESKLPLGILVISILVLVIFYLLYFTQGVMYFSISQDARPWFKEIMQPLLNKPDIGMFLLPLQLFLVIYLTLMILLRAFQFPRVISSARQQGQFHLIHLHPDRTGGFGPLREYIANYTKIIALCGLFMGLLSLGAYFRGSSVFDYNLVWVLIFYMTAVPLFYFFTIKDARAAMKNAKKDVLTKISRKYHKVFIKNHDMLDNDGNQIDIAHSMEQMLNLEEIYGKVEKLPTWPFDIAKNARNVGFSLLPALLSIAFRIWELLAHN